MELLDIINTDLPSTLAVNMKSDKVMIVQGGALKYTSPSILSGKNPGVGIGSDTLVDLTGLETNAALITGTTDIGTIPLEENKRFYATFEDSLVLMYDATDLPLPGNADILTMPGDLAVLVGGPGDVAYVESYISKAAQLIPRIVEVVSEADTYADCDTTDIYAITALATDVVIHDIAGTPRDGQTLTFVIKAVTATREISCPDFTSVGANAFDFNLAANYTVFIDCQYNFAGGGWFASVRRQDDLYALQSQIADLQGMTRPIVPVTDAESPYLVDAALHVPGTIFTNTGTAGDVIFVLDDGANCAAGKTRFTFRNRDTTTTYKIQIQVNGTDHLYFDILGSPLDITGGATIGDDRKPNTFMTVEYQGGGVWASDGNSQNWS